MISEYELGTIVQMKKQHPCGSWQWEVIRLGADIKIVDFPDNDDSEKIISVV